VAPNFKRNFNLIWQAEAFCQDMRKFVNKRKFYDETSRSVISQSQKLMRSVDFRMIALRRWLG
jgi:hypothetical protein